MILSEMIPDTNNTIPRQQSTSKSPLGARSSRCFLSLHDILTMPTIPDKTLLHPYKYIKLYGDTRCYLKILNNTYFQMTFDEVTYEEVQQGTLVKRERRNTTDLHILTSIDQLFCIRYQTSPSVSVPWG
jgi:hypothetical protein